MDPSGISSVNLSHTWPVGKIKSGFVKFLTRFSLTLKHPVVTAFVSTIIDAGDAEWLRNWTEIINYQWHALICLTIYIRVLSSSIPETIRRAYRKGPVFLRKVSRRLIFQLQQISQREWRCIVKIQEHYARDIFKKYGLPVPDFGLATNPDEARALAKELGTPVVVKAQVLVGGRGKAGGVKLADDIDEARDKAGAILGMDIKGLKVEKVLVAKSVDIDKEYYIGIVLDRDRKQHVVIASPAGGVDIEQVAEETPDKIGKVWIDPKYGLHAYECRKMLFDIGFEQKVALHAAAILQKLYQIVLDHDCSLVEINPLVLSPDGNIWAIDAKINFDDSGLFRHPELRKLKESEDTDPIERDAHSRGLTYVRLEDGNVGIIGNGAGLVMGTMDEVKRFGRDIAKPANFLDIGGGARADSVKNSLEVVLSDPNVKAVLINVFGGITRCDEVARGLNEAIESVKTDIPIFVRLEGTNSVEGREILNGDAFHVIETLDQAAEPIIGYVSEGAVR